MTEEGRIGRMKRARAIAAKPGAVRDLGGKFAVSGTGGRIYFVDIEAGTCECEDHAHNGAVMSCKHILAVTLVEAKRREAASCEASRSFFHAMRARKRAASTARSIAAGRGHENIHRGA